MDGPPRQRRRDRNADDAPALLPPVSILRAREIASRFPAASILVVGDAMLDRFIVGRVTRISPEAPVPVVAFQHETYRIGGAANVAHGIAALGGRATLVAVTGQDDGAAVLAQACHAAGVAPSLVGDPDRPTTIKMRIVTDRNQQVARVDYEHDVEIAGDTQRRVMAAVLQHVVRADAVIVSDYLKGCVTAPLVEAAVTAAAARGIPVLIDPKIPHIDAYAGATLVTPNHHEAEIASHTRVRTHDEARLAARRFRERARCRSVLMTRGDQGMWLLSDEVEGYLPAASREVADVTGAGDTVIATVGLALAAGATLVEAVGLANEAAGIVVGKFGPATVTAAELLAAVEVGR
jgi:D-beta-D-heptose 7-phosphate kinase/D-beta-D-heptose 1-phosphate adenosyltransferase